MDSKKEHYISADIYKGFYYNKDLDTSTIIKEYDAIEGVFDQSRFIACITIQVPHLHSVEYKYGSHIYNNLLAKTNEILKKLKHDIFRKDDILIVDLFEIDTFVMFLSPPRDNNTQILDHIEPMVERARNYMEEEIFQLFYPYTKEYSKPAVGYSLVINNPMINNMRLIMGLVNQSKRMGEFLAERQKYQSLYQLQKLILNQDIKTVFQAVVDINSLDVIGYEALSRGPVDSDFNSPLIMFLLAAEYGLTFELDSICRKTAFESARHIDPDTKIFVNTLPMTIHDPEFRGKYLEDLLQDVKVKPENVIFEVNEGLAIDNYDLFKSALKDYSDIGIVHASDDIGRGYADLERILELAPGFMKLDISMIRGIHESYIKQQMVKAMVGLAGNITSKVIAEGIECKEEYEALKELGVDYGQGYLFGRPSEKPGPINKEFLTEE